MHWRAKVCWFLWIVRRVKDQLISKRRMVKRSLQHVERWDLCTSLFWRVLHSEWGKKWIHKRTRGKGLGGTWFSISQISVTNVSDPISLFGQYYSRNNRREPPNKLQKKSRASISNNELLIEAASQPEINKNNWCRHWPGEHFTVRSN